MLSVSTTSNDPERKQLLKFLAATVTTGLCFGIFRLRPWLQD